MNVYLQNHRLDPKDRPHSRPGAWGCGASITSRSGKRAASILPKSFTRCGRLATTGYVTVHQAYAELMGPREAAAKSAEYLRRLGGFSPPGSDNP